jgi:hypothetical protein
MSPISEIRLANLEALVKEHGTLDEVAGLGGSSSVYLSQLRNQAVDVKTGKVREMGNAMARRLEKGCGKPIGWMDQPQPDPSAPASQATTEQAAPSQAHGRPTPVAADVIAQLGQLLAAVQIEQIEGVVTLLSVFARERGHDVFAGPLAYTLARANQQSGDAKLDSFNALTSQQQNANIIATARFAAESRNASDPPQAQPNAAPMHKEA